MSVNLEALGTDRLSASERLELIEQPWDSLPEQVAPNEVPDWHLAELARRRCLGEAQPGSEKPWRELSGPQSLV
jgi:putative addiction module component (TIGR02574 family)